MIQTRWWLTLPGRKCEGVWVKKKKTPWDLEATHVPRADIKTGRKGRLLSKLLRIGLVITILQAPLSFLGLLNFVATMGSDPATDTGPNIQQVAVEPAPGQGEARLAVQKWLDAQATNGGLTGTSIVSWAGSTTAKALDTPTSEAFIHSFDVQTAELGMVRVQQVVYAEKGSMAVVASDSAPAIVARGQMDSRVSTTTTWAGFHTAGELTGIDSAATTWARSYTSGDSESVRVAVRDPQLTHVYPTLDGVQQVQVEMVDVAQRTVEANASDKEKDDAASFALARVKVTVLWSEDARANTSSGASDGGGENPAKKQADISSGQGTTMTFDLLLTDVASGAPLVKAWGPEGSGPTLKEYQNAWTKKDN